MITSDEINESCGLWSMIMTHCPKAEINEIKRNIGIKLIYRCIECLERIKCPS